MNTYEILKRDYDELERKYEALVNGSNKLLEKWRTGTIGSPFGLEGIAGMRQGREGCADDLEALLENDE